MLRQLLRQWRTSGTVPVMCLQVKAKVHTYETRTGRNHEEEGKEAHIRGRRSTTRDTRKPCNPILVVFNR